MDFSAYSSAFSGLLVVLTTLIVQFIVANTGKARLPNHIPGKIDPSLGHESFVFRAYRTMENSLENISLFLGSAFLAILAGVNPVWTGFAVWIYALARIMHMILYYMISTEQNPSPRSYFYLLGLLANILLLILILTRLL
ncbi:MAPEG family protein [Psychromonas sp.]|uniref:MAPEG family protein n=1 Tax=Psychromonas sp. TaxID=1884585 RepID=UPI00356A5D4D